MADEKKTQYQHLEEQQKNAEAGAAGDVEVRQLSTREKPAPDAEAKVAVAKQESVREMSTFHRSKFHHDHIYGDPKTGFVYQIQFKGDDMDKCNTDLKEKKSDDGIEEQDTIITSPPSQLGALSQAADVMFDSNINLEIPELKAHASMVKTKQLKEANRRIVFWECKIKRISDINTTLETFRCRFHFYLTWLATKEEESDYNAFLVQKEKSLDQSQTWVPDWIPRIEFTNAVNIAYFGEHGKKYEIRDAVNNSSFRKSWEEDDPKYARLLGFDPHQAKWIRCRYEADIAFAEEMELETFPFDCQDFTMYFKSELNEKYVALLPFPRKSSFCTLDPQFSVLSEWDLEKVLVEFKTTATSRSRSGRAYPIIAIHIKAARKWQTHIGNIFVTFCMFALGLGTFSMGTDNEELGERLGYAVTLMLADVASLQLLFDSLPKIPYWTELDFYMYTCFFYLVMITGWSCIVGVNSSSIEIWDWFARIVFFILLVTANCVFLARAVHLYYSERMTLDLNDMQLKQYYANRRSKVDRRALVCDWSFSTIDQQRDQDTLLFAGEKSDTQQHSGSREILKMGTFGVKYMEPTQSLYSAIMAQERDKLKNRTIRTETVSDTRT